MPNARTSSHAIMAGIQTAATMNAAAPSAVRFESFPVQADQGIIPWAVNDGKSKAPKVKRLSQLDDRSMRADGKVEFTWWIDYLTRGMAELFFNTVLGLTANVLGHWTPASGFNSVVSTLVTASCPAITTVYSGGAYHNYAALFTGTVWIASFEESQLGGWQNIELQFVECTYLADWTFTV